MIIASKKNLIDNIKKYFGITDNNTSEWAVVNTNSLAAISLIIIIRSKYLPILSDIKTNTFMQGLNGLLPNKGGVATSFKLGLRHLLFINCHLSSDEPYRDIRMQQWEELREVFVDEIEGWSCLKSGAVIDGDDSKWDGVIWMGDFNSRIQTSKFLMPKNNKAKAN